MDRLKHLPLFISKQLALLLVLALDLYQGLHNKGQNKRLNLLDPRTHQRVLPLPLHLLMAQVRQDPKAHTQSGQAALNSKSLYHDD